MNYLKLKLLIKALEGRWDAEALYSDLLLELARGTEKEARAWWADHVGPHRPFPQSLFSSH